MLNFLPSVLIGIVAAILLALNVLFWTSILFAFSVLKFLLPIKLIRRLIDPVLIWLSERWIFCNSGWMRLTQKTKWDVQGMSGLNYRGWYLVSSNHQSWVDIFVVQHLLNRRIPFMKFFLKRELIWVPVMGIAWWALDFPFLRRYSNNYLQKHPEKRGKDFEITRKACEKFKNIPTSVMNFLEGTRLTVRKHAKQKSPYKNLLKPKAGGLALALNVLGEQFDSLINITIVYPDGIPTFWQFLCGRVKRIVVRIAQVNIPSEFTCGDYENDLVFRTRIQEWVVKLWEEKDIQITELKKEAAVT